MDLTTFYVLYGLIVLETLVIVLARRDIMFWFQCKLKKRKGFGEVIELRSDKTLHISLQKIGAKATEVKDKTYSTDPLDVCFEPNHQISAVVVCENTAKSVGFAESGIATAQELSSLVKQAKRIGAMGNNSLQKWLRIALYAGAGALLLLVYIAYTLAKGQAATNQILTLVQGLKAAGSVVV